MAETLNLSRLEGYQVGGMIHIIANNQLGFTAEPKESFSTSYASGLARGFKIPIVHVNADDPVACIEAARLSWAYRHTFKLDFLIDLVGYRRYGHNEGDEPAFTQPQIYQIVTGHPTVREQFARQLVEKGELPPELPDDLVKEHQRELETSLRGAETGRRLRAADPRASAERRGATGADRGAAGAARRAQSRAADGTGRLHRSSQARTRTRTPRGHARAA